MFSTWLWNVNRSIKAATIVVFSNRSVHLENGRFVVTIVLLFSLRSEITLNSSSDWCRFKTEVTQFIQNQQISFS